MSTAYSHTRSSLFILQLSLSFLLVTLLQGKFSISIPPLTSTFNSHHLQHSSSLSTDPVHFNRCSKFSNICPTQHIFLSFLIPLPLGNLVLLDAQHFSLSHCLFFFIPDHLKTTVKITKSPKIHFMCFFDLVSTPSFATHSSIAQMLSWPSMVSWPSHTL